MPGERWIELVEIAHAQYGYVTAADSLESGANKDYLDHLDDRGQIERVARGLYRVPSVPVTSLDPYMEAVLWAGEGAAVSHDSVLALHGLAYVNPKTIRITTSRRVRKSDPPSDIEVVTRRLDPSEFSFFEGIPCTTVARAIVDAQPYVRRDRLVEAADQAREGGLLLLEEYQAVAEALEMTLG